ncbi:pitrilysin family protein [Andreprevotia sp. IGB-42]|uniref:M16 family metallopeptidase n=1 Tax=Andreprevotia sp. IGB-42 TaxID=2497473 RepID=UPI00135BAECC|nr:pitrilysin family protein [Andreprevotia sp. IGB-42]
MHALRTITLAGLCLLGATAMAASEPLQDSMLANGMRVLIQPDHRAPVAVVQVWYRVGGIDEPAGKTGISHLVEHMMFKGTPALPAGGYSKLLSSLGGSDNAYTTPDHTYYYSKVPAQQLSRILGVEADRMQNLLFDATAFKLEKSVVEEERRWRVDDNSYGEFYEKLAASAFGKHPYANPVLGWPEDFSSITLEDARAWYQRWYTPANATVIVLGDVEPQAALAEVQRAFGGIKSRPLPERAMPPTPPQDAMQKHTIPVPADRPLVVLQWRVPTLQTDEADKRTYALAMLAELLDNDPYTLEYEVAERVNGLSVSYTGMSRGFGEFTISATPGKGRSTEEVAKALQRQMALLRSSTLHTESVDHGKLNWASKNAFASDSMLDRATTLGRTVMYGFPPDYLSRMQTQIDKVTAADLVSTAKELLTEDRMTIGILEPTERVARKHQGAIHAR